MRFFKSQLPFIILNSISILGTAAKNHLLNRIKSQRDSDLDSNSSGSEDHPLREPLVGAKRKAEVLKESGKIGVTIKTSPASSSAATTNSSGKVASSQPQQSPPVKVQLLDTNTSSNKHKTIQVSVPTHRTQLSKNIGEPAAPLSPETPASRPESNTPPELNIEHKEQRNVDVQGLVVVAPAQGNESPRHHEEEDEEDNFLNKLDNNNIPLSPNTAAPKLWLPKNRVTDQIFITDVTVNLETVTIRECKTERGFFRERDLTTTPTST